MRTPANHLLDTLGAIAAHRELIGETYARGTSSRTAENAGEVYVLQQLRIFLTDGHDRFRLSRHLTRFLDDITQKQRLYELLGDDIGNLNNRVHQLRDEYVSAVMDSQLDAIDAIAGDFHDACAELSDAVTSSISRLLLQAESDFAAVRTLSAKERQNKHYLDQADKLSQALGSLDRMNMQELLDSGMPAYAGLAEPYRRLITKRLNEWNTELSRVTGILKAYLYKLRQIAPDVKRLRAFSRFLHQNPDYTPPDFTDQRALPTWLQRDPGIRLDAYPDTADATLTDELEAIARKLPAPKVAIRKQREAGSLSRRDADKEPVTITQPPYRIALHRLGVAALQSAEPISAVKWKRQHATGLDVPDDIWILLVLHSRDIDKLPFRRIAYQSIGQPGDAQISRNQYIKDVVLRVL
jgi:hypothetical protein